MAFDAGIDYQAKKNALKKQMETETDPTRRAALQAEYDAADQSRMEKMASDLTKYGKYATGGELDRAAGIQAESTIGTQYQQQADNLNKYYDQAKQNANNDALSRGMARSSYVGDRMASLDSDRAQGLSDIDATKALALQKAKTDILSDYHAGQEKALATEKKDFSNNINAYYNDFQQEINNVQGDGDTSNDWKIPILQAARNEKIAAQQKMAENDTPKGVFPPPPPPALLTVDFAGADAYAAKGGYLGDYFAANYKAMGFSSAAQAEAAYNIYKFEKGAPPTGDTGTTYTNPLIKQISYLPAQAQVSALKQYVASGKISETEAQAYLTSKGWA